MNELKRFFESPQSPAQRRYEAIRAVKIDKLSVADAAKKFGYTKQSLYSYMRDARTKKLDLFPSGTKTPNHGTPNEVIADTLYHRFAQDLPRFEHEKAGTLFKRFINMPGKISFDGS